MTSSLHLTVIGGGAMGEAFVAGLLRSQGAFQPDDIAVVEPVAARQEVLRRQYGVRTDSTMEQFVAGADVVLCAVKPDQFGMVAAELQGLLAPEQLVMTLMAGVTIGSVVAGLQHAAVVRLMPNILCRVGAGMIVWQATPEVTAEQRALCRRCFGAMGAELEVADEKYLDMATAVSGSGPAYMFLIVEALTDAGVHLGFRRDQAAVLAQQTMLGAAQLIQQEPQHPAQLRNTVTSPGGTTVEGLLVLEQRGVRAAVVEAVLAAYAKAQKLG